MARKTTAGKKVGKIFVKLQRDRGYRQGHGEVSFDLYLDDEGIFHAYHEGAHHRANTKDALAESLRVAVEKAVDLVWDRYILIDYEAEIWPSDGDSGRPLSHGELSHMRADDDRDAALNNPISSWRHGKGHTLPHPNLITQISIGWSIVEYTRPYNVPESEVPVRSRRDVSMTGIDADGEPEHVEPVAWVERIGDPKEQASAELPRGCVLYTMEREDVLRGILAALRGVDERLAALFRGAPERLETSLDTAALSLGESGVLALGSGES